jgi:two-component system, OmpR family, response regulator QseB
MIFFLEDEVSIAEPVIARLNRQGYEVCWFRSRAEAEKALLESVPELVLIDVHLQDGEEAGFEFLQMIRESGLTMPILMLTARDAVEDRVLGLDLGADDYLPKPFDLSEVSARVRALLRRTSEIKENKLIHGDLELDFELRTVLWRGHEIALTPREYTLLEVFARNPTRVFSTEELIDRVWNEKIENSNVVRVYIHYLRNKLNSSIVEKISGGYRLGE